MEEQRRSRGDKDGGAALVMEAAQTDARKEGHCRHQRPHQVEWDATGTYSDYTATVKVIYTTGKTFVEEASAVGDDEEAVDVGIVLDQTSFYEAVIYDSACSALAKTAPSRRKSTCSTARLGVRAPHRAGVKGTVKVGDTVTLSVNYNRRAEAAKNHTSTHLLNYALRSVLATR